MFACMFELWCIVPVNSFGHDGTLTPFYGVLLKIRTTVVMGGAMGSFSETYGSIFMGPFQISVALEMEP